MEEEYRGEYIHTYFVSAWAIILFGSLFDISSYLMSYNFTTVKCVELAAKACMVLPCDKLWEWGGFVHVVPRACIERQLHNESKTNLTCIQLGAGGNSASADG